MNARSFSRKAAQARIESLETRRLLSATVSTTLADSFVSNGSTPTTVDLSNAFTDPAAELVNFTTNEGPIDLQLFPQAAPKTVANFLKYVNSGLYNNTVVHRSAPGFVIQGGGYTPDGGAIQTFPPIVDEATANVPNVSGTIAMARMTAANTATSQWFINLADNRSSLDPAPKNPGYAVFGKVINGTMSTANAIAALPITDGSAVNGAWNTLPVLQQTAPLTASNYVVVSNAQQLPESSLFTYSATSDNPSLVAPSISGTGLTLTYPNAGATGIAHVTVTATDSADGSTASQTFLAAVGVLPVALGTGGERSVSFTSASGKPVTVSFSGPGSATVTFTGTGLSSTVNAKHKTAVITGAAADTGIADISTTGTTARSALTVASKGGALNIVSLNTNAAIGAINAAPVTLTGSTILAGPVSKLTLGSLSGASLAFSGAAGAVTIGPVANSVINSSAPIKSLTVRGDVSGSSIDLTAPTTGKATDVGKLTVTGAISSSFINSTGSLGSVSAAALAQSSLYAGVTPANNASLPASLAEFTTQSTIASVKIGALTGSDISAFAIGKAAFGLVHLANGGVPFGIAATSIASLSGKTDASTKFNLKKLTSQSLVASELAKEKLTLTGTDLQILII